MNTSLGTVIHTEKLFINQPEEILSNFGGAYRQNAILIEECSQFYQGSVIARAMSQQHAGRVQCEKCV